MTKDFVPMLEMLSDITHNFIKRMDYTMLHLHPNAGALRARAEAAKMIANGIEYALDVYIQIEKEKKENET